MTPFPLSSRKLQLGSPKVPRLLQDNCYWFIRVFLLSLGFLLKDLFNFPGRGTQRHYLRHNSYGYPCPQRHLVTFNLNVTLYDVNWLRHNPRAKSCIVYDLVWITWLFEEKKLLKHVLGKKYSRKGLTWNFRAQYFFCWYNNQYYENN